jgi:hypothetical protein
VLAVTVASRVVLVFCATVMNIGDNILLVGIIQLIRTGAW